MARQWPKDSTLEESFNVVDMHHNGLIHNLSLTVIEMEIVCFFCLQVCALKTTYMYIPLYRGKSGICRNIHYFSLYWLEMQIEGNPQWVNIFYGIIIGRLILMSI